MSELESKVPFIPVEPADPTRADKIANQFRAEALEPIIPAGVDLGFKSPQLIAKEEEMARIAEQTGQEVKAGVAHFNESGLPDIKEEE